MLVMLRKDWPGNFRRQLRDKKGKPTGKALVFAPGEPLELSKAEYAAVESDVGKCLLLVSRDARGKAKPLAAGEPPENVAHVLGEALLAELAGRGAEEALARIRTDPRAAAAGIVDCLEVFDEPPEPTPDP